MSLLDGQRKGKGRGMDEEQRGAERGRGRVGRGCAAVGRIIQLCRLTGRSGRYQVGANTQHEIAICAALYRDW